MADTKLYLNESAMAKAAVVKTALAGGKVRFFKSGLTVDRFTTRAQLIAAECDFDGYTAGGYSISAWTGPTLPEGGGALITSPLVNPAYSTPSDPPVTNQVGGWWIDTAASPGPANVWLVGTYSPARPMVTVGDGWPWLAQIVEALNPNVIE